MKTITELQMQDPKTRELVDRNPDRVPGAE